MSAMKHQNLWHPVTHQTMTLTLTLKCDLGFWLRNPSLTMHNIVASVLFPLQHYLFNPPILLTLRVLKHWYCMKSLWTGPDWRRACQETALQGHECMRHRDT